MLMKCCIALDRSSGKTYRVSKSRSPCISRKVDDMKTRTFLHQGALLSIFGEKDIAGFFAFDLTLEICEIETYVQVKL